jgi:hypothetical protein
VWSVEVVFERSVGKLNVDPVEIQEIYLSTLTKVWFNLCNLGALASKFYGVITDIGGIFSVIYVERYEKLRLKIGR